MDGGQFEYGWKPALEVRSLGSGPGGSLEGDGWAMDRGLVLEPLTGSVTGF